MLFRAILVSAIICLRAGSLAAEMLGREGETNYYSTPRLTRLLILYRDGTRQSQGKIEASEELKLAPLMPEPKNENAQLSRVQKSGTPADWAFPEYSVEPGPVAPLISLATGATTN